MKRRKLGFLRVQPVDYRSLPLLLEQQEKQGWRLERILWPWIGLFCPVKKETHRYTADLIPQKALRDEE